MGLGTAFEDLGKFRKYLGRFRKFAKLKIVLKVENRSCGRFLFWGAFVVAGLGFCRCVRVFWGLKLVLFFLPLFGVVFGVCVGFVGVETVPFLSQKG